MQSDAHYLAIRIDNKMLNIGTLSGREIFVSVPCGLVLLNPYS